jgi:hypothetical protein
MSSTDLVTTGETSPFLALRSTQEELTTLITETVGVDGISASDLDRVKFPAGGATSWEVPTLSGEESTKTIEGIILGRYTRRSYWKEKYEGQNDPPDCASNDGITGEGDPGGNCAECAFNEFGSSANGHGKACKESRQLFILQKDSLIPIVINVPPGSLAIINKYSLRLLKAQLSPYGVVTRLELEKAENAGGIKFSKLKLTAAERLDPQATSVMRAYADKFTQVAAQVGIEREDIDPEYDGTA